MTNTHLKPRTIREWLDLIPFDRARREAIDLCEKDVPYTGYLVKNSLSGALVEAFVWPHDCWCDLHDQIIRMEESIKIKQEPTTMGMSY